MEEDFIADDVRKRLILGGLSELSEHGIHDFSLRRVAVRAEVSCAAPYRHFKDKDALILAIIEYVREGFLLLTTEAASALGENSVECIAELSVLSVRFWLGNGNFRSVLSLLLSGDAIGSCGISGFNKPISDNISAFTRLRALTEEDARVLTATVLSFIYGTLTLAGASFENTDFLLSNLRNRILECFIPYI